MTDCDLAACCVAQIMKRVLVAFGLATSFLVGCNKTQTDLQHDLGFHHGTPYYNINGTGTEVINVSSVQRGGVFAQSGFKVGDVFLDFHSNNSINDLYAHLESSRGKTITLRVVSGGNGLPLAQRSVRSITFTVPPSA
jgi:hypothetical protein